jgi:hypothetical protein
MAQKNNAVKSRESKDIKGTKASKVKTYSGSGKNTNGSAGLIKSNALYESLAIEDRQHIFEHIRFLEERVEALESRAEHIEERLAEIQELMHDIFLAEADMDEEDEDEVDEDEEPEDHFRQKFDTSTYFV